MLNVEMPSLDLLYDLFVSNIDTTSAGLVQWISDSGEGIEAVREEDDGR